MALPYYWKRGVIAGVAIWLILSYLVSRLEVREQIAGSNMPQETEIKLKKPAHQTDFGGFLGVLVFALFCVVPGPYHNQRSQDAAAKALKPSAP
jgi:hypothetical protein